MTLHLDDKNVDALPSFSDIWQKILEPNYLNLLTDQQVGPNVIRNIDFLSNPNWSASDGAKLKNMKSLYQQSTENPAMS